MNDNLITFSGWVGGPVELTHVGEGVPVASLRVGSTPRRLREGRWEDGETVWYSVKAWRSLAEHLATSVKTGEPVLVSGRMTAESWTSPDGTLNTRHVVVAASVGHDLTRGTSTFVRASSRGTFVADAAAPTTEEGEHEAEESVDSASTGAALEGHSGAAA